MKKIITIFFIAIANIGFGQGYPIQQNIGSGSTLVRVPPDGGFQASLINRNFVDTTAANATNIKYYPGSQIFTTLDTSLWIRNTQTTRWLRLQASGQIINGDLINYLVDVNRPPGQLNVYGKFFNGVNTYARLLYTDSIGSGGGSSYTFPYSVVAPGNAIQLENDTTANPANYFYGRNSAGRRGWYPQSGITGVNIYNSDGTFTGYRTVNGNYNGFEMSNISSLNIGIDDNAGMTGGINIGGDNADNNYHIRTIGSVGESGIHGYRSENKLYSVTAGSDSSFVQTDGENGISIKAFDGSLKIPLLNYTLSTTGKKIMIRDTATGLVQNIDPALIVSGYVPTSRTITLNGVSYDLSDNRTWSVGTLVAGDTISLSDRINNRWALNGNTGSSTSTFGTTGNFGYYLITNNMRRGRFTSGGHLVLGDSTLDDGQTFQVHKGDIYVSGTGTGGFQFPLQVANGNGNPIFSVENNGNVYIGQHSTNPANALVFSKNANQLYGLSQYNYSTLTYQPIWLSQYGGGVKIGYTPAGTFGDSVLVKGSDSTVRAVAASEFGGGGISAIGTINSETKSANGAVISGTDLVMQTVDATYPGLMTSALKAKYDSLYNGDVRDSISYVTRVGAGEYDTLKVLVYAFPDYTTVDSTRIGLITKVTASSTTTFTNKTFNADGTGNSITNIENADIKSGAAIDATKIADGTVTSTEFQYINTLSSNVQTQINALPTASSTTTFSNKRWTARVGSTTSSATPTINTDNYDIYKLTAQTANITSFTTNLTGTPNDGDVLEIQVTGTAARTLAFGSSFVASTVALPTTTVTTATLTVIFQYYTTSSYGNNKWVCVNSY